MASVKVRPVGTSSGIILPRDIMTRLRIENGDTLFITETPNGIQLSPYNADFERQMKAARKVMREDRDVLRELAR